MHLYFPFQIGDEYFTFVTECKNPKACTLVLRGPSKDIINEVERNLQDALGVARNLVLEPRLVIGGGACEMAVAHALQEKAKSISGVKQWPYSSVAQALEVMIIIKLLIYLLVEFLLLSFFPTVFILYMLKKFFLNMLSIHFRIL